MLQAIEDRYKEQGVAVLAVSLDPPEERSKIPAYLKKFGLHTHVLLAEAGQLKGYDDRIMGQLYLIDRAGLLAGLPGDFEGDFRKEAEAGIQSPLTGAPAQGRVILTVDEAPAGFTILWKHALDGPVSGLTVAPPTRGHPAEIGLISDSRLQRFSSSGEALGEAQLPNNEYRGLIGIDLDGDGEDEWIAQDDQSFSLVNSRGEPYWYYPSMSKSLEVAGFRDLDGDGRLEIVVKDGSSVVAKKAFPGVLWRTPPLGTLRAVVLDSGGALLAQTSDAVRTLDREGVPTGAGEAIVGAAILRGRIDAPGGDPLDVYADASGGRVELTNSLTGSGRQEILVLETHAATVFSQGGKDRLRLWIGDSPDVLQAAVGDLDGRPGDELVLFIPQYGLVTLGRRTPTGQARPANDSEAGTGLGAR